MTDRATVCPAHTPRPWCTALLSWLMSSPAEPAPPLRHRPHRPHRAGDRRRQRHRRRVRRTAGRRRRQRVAVDRDEAGLTRLAATSPASSRWPATCPTSTPSTPCPADRRRPGQQRRHPARRADPGVPPERFAPDPAADARGAVPAGAPRRCPHMYERGWGRVVNISSVHGLRASPFKAAYVSGQARARGPVQGDRAGGRRARRHQQLRQPGLRADAAGGEADRRPGPRPRHRRGRGLREGAARAGRGQAAGRAGTRSPSSSPSSAGRRRPRSPARPSRWTAAGPR